MFKTKTIEIFYALSRYEQRALCRWVDSPYHNQRPDVQRLCYYLYEKAYQQRDLLRKEQVFAAVFGDETAFDSRPLHYASSFLLQQIEAFLIHTQQKQQPHWEQLHLIQAYRRLKLPAIFSKKMEELKKSQTDVKIQDARYHALQYQIELETLAFSEQQERDAPLNLQPMVFALDVQYIAEKLKQGCFIAAHEAVYKTLYRRGTFDLIMQYVAQKPDLLAVPAIGLYYYYCNINLAEQPVDKKQFFDLFKAMLLEKGHLFEEVESRDLYKLAINYTIRHYNTSGDIAYLREMLQLYQSALNIGCLLENKVLSPFAFKNISGIAMRLQELDWAKTFIDQYAPALPSKDRDTYTHYALSKLAFTQHDYQEAMQRLQKVEYSDIFLNLDAKVMLMKIYYELQEYDALEAFLQSFDAFLRRKNQLGYHRDNYKNTLSFLKKLLYLHPITPQKIENLRSEINQTPALGEKDWLLTQIQLKE